MWCFVHITNISLLGDEYARQVHFLEFEDHVRGREGSDVVGDRLADAEGLCVWVWV